MCGLDRDVQTGAKCLSNVSRFPLSCILVGAHHISVGHPDCSDLSMVQRAIDQIVVFYLWSNGRRNRYNSDLRSIISCAFQERTTLKLTSSLPDRLNHDRNRTRAHIMDSITVHRFDQCIDRVFGIAISDTTFGSNRVASDWVERRARAMS
jgi:hypothetical protein